jgi:predicted aspartyl protease
MTRQQKTVAVRTPTGRASAYAERVSPEPTGERIEVRVYDDVAGHYSVHHSLTAAQVQYVISRTLLRVTQDAAA